MESLVHAMLSNALAATVLAVVVAGLGWACRRPALIHGLWLVVMIKLVTPPVVPVLLPIAVGVVPAGTRAAEVHSDRDRGPARIRPDLDAGVAGEPRFLELPFHAEPARPDSTRPDLETGAGATPFVNARPEDPSVTFVLPAALRWEHLVLSLVLSGALGWWTLATVRIVRFQRVLRDVRPLPGDWQARTDELAERLGLARPPAVCLVPGRVPPMLWAIGARPRLLVPSQLWATMSADERTSLLLHELAHLRRRDHWVRWLELIVAGLYWWLPAAWWIRRSLREAEEQCCDAWVIWAMPRGAKTYAAALLAALEFVSGARTAPVAASATSGNGHVSCLKRRLRMIVRAETPKGLSWAGRLAVMGTAALLLPLAPSWAQKDDPAKPPAARDRLITDDDSKANVDKVEKLKEQYGELLKERRTNLRKLAQTVGSDDRQTLAYRQQIAMEHLAYVRKDLEDVQSQKRKVQARLKAQRPKEPRGETSAPPATEADINAWIDGKPSIASLIAKLAQDEQKLNSETAHRRLAARNPSGDPLLKRMQRDVAATQKLLKSKRAALRPIAIEQLQQKHRGDQATRGDGIEQELAMLDDLEQRLSAEINSISKEMNSKNLNSDEQLENRISDKLMKDPDVVARSRELQEAKERLDRVKAQARQVNDPAQRAAEKQHKKALEQYTELLNVKDKELRARLSQDDDKDDDAKKNKGQDAAERLEEHVKDLIDKLGKELGPVGEEIRKALEQAVREVHQSLEKEGVSVEDLRRALERSHEKLRGAVEKGGPVNEEMRKAMERAREEMRKATERAREEMREAMEDSRKEMREAMRNRLEAARERQHELAKKNQPESERAKADSSERERLKAEAEKRAAKDGEGQPNREELNTARQEIRQLEQQLRQATRRLEQLQRRESLRNAAPRRPGRPDSPRAETAPPQDPTAPRAETARSPRSPVPPTAPATPARPAQPNARRPSSPPRGPEANDGGGPRRGDRFGVPPNFEHRFQELDDKLDRLLKELEKMKNEKKPNEIREPRARVARPAQPGGPTAF
ncbi:MAG: M56 family metallopeptidase [Isosphaerales bacterium]